MLSELDSGCTSIGKATNAAPILSTLVCLGAASRRFVCGQLPGWRGLYSGRSGLEIAQFFHFANNLGYAFCQSFLVGFAVDFRV
jgi:hypothetical protein